jgi:uracil-DNA glycosylase
MEWSKFQNKFHESYHEIMKQFIESEKCDEIYTFLKKESGRGAMLAPQSINTFRVFKEIPLKDIKCIFMFQDPYFTFRDGLPIANGIALDCSITKKLQPTLRQFYNGIEEELYGGLSLKWNMENYDLSYLSEQGIMMLNASLTVEKDKAGSHKELWRPFTEYIIKKIVNKYNIPIVLLGKDAQEYESLITSDVFITSHPASASYNEGKWNTNNVFTELEDVIWKQHKEIVLWLPDIECPF